MNDEAKPWGVGPNWAGLAVAAGLLGMVWWLSDDTLTPNKRPDDPNQMWLFEDDEVPRYPHRRYKVAEFGDKEHRGILKRWFRWYNIPVSFQRVSDTKYGLYVKGKYFHEARDIANNVAVTREADESKLCPTTSQEKAGRSATSTPRRPCGVAGRWPGGRTAAAP